jgi:hypothetical protein
MFQLIYWVLTLIFATVGFGGGTPFNLFGLLTPGVF